MFGYKLVHDAELEYLAASHNLAIQERDNLISMLNKQLEMLEKELAYYRERSEDERQRADRISDALMQQNGLPEVTNTTRRDRKDQQEAVDQELEKRRGELQEMFAETMNTTYTEEGLELPDDLAEAAQQMLDKAKGKK